MGFEPKLEPKSKELPAMYREFEDKVEELKLANLSALIDVKVSLPLEVRIIEEERLCRPGS